MSSDALERLKKRQRPSVPNRDTSLSPSVDISTSRYQDSSDIDISTSRYQDSSDIDISTSGYQDSSDIDISTSGYQESPSQESPGIDTSTSGQQDSQVSPGIDISTSGQQDSQVSQQEPEQLLTKQTTFRLEAALSQRMSEVCQNNGISREVLIEALFEHYSNDPEAWQAILVEAKRRGEHRTKLANLKRAKSMMQRFYH